MLEFWRSWVHRFPIITITPSSIIKDFRTVVLIFIVISTMFRPIYAPVYFTCLSNSGTFTELRTTSFIEPMRVACSDSVNHNRVQEFSIPVLLLACSHDWTRNLEITESEQMTPVDSIKDVVRSSMKVPEFDKHLKKAGGHIGRNDVEITITMKTIVRKPLMIKITKLCLRNFDN